MGRFCAMRTCIHRDAVKPGVERYRFPEDREIRRQWDKFVNEANRTMGFRSSSSPNTSLCQRHFESSCYLANGSLKPNAVPTVADKFTPEAAFKFHLIPSLDSPLLEDVNRFHSSIVKRILKPVPAKSNNYVCNPVAVEVQKKSLAENMFSNGSLELMVIDLGEAPHKEEVSSTNTEDVLLSSPTIDNAEPVGNYFDIFSTPRLKEVNDSNDPGQCAQSSSSRLPLNETTIGEPPKAGNSELCEITQEEQKEFQPLSEELGELKQEIRSVKRKYNRAMMKIGNLTDILKHLKATKRDRSEKFAQLDTCLHCGKAFVS